MSARARSKLKDVFTDLRQKIPGGTKGIGAAILCWMFVGSLASGQTNASDSGETTNLLKNGSFEQDGTVTAGQSKPGAWEFGDPADTYTGEYIEDESTKAHSGSRAVGIISKETSGGNYAAWHSDLIEVTPGSVYAVKGWIKTSECVGKGAWLWIYGYENRKGEMLPVGTVSLSSPDIVDTQDWQEWSAEIHVSENIRWLGIACRLDGEGKAWFDDVSVSLVK